MSQNDPAQPITHEHCALPATLWQKAPFRQGCEVHGLSSTNDQ